MNVGTIVEFFFDALVLLGALNVLGYPLYRLIQKVGGTRAPSVATPILGLYPLVTVAWLWSTVGPGGLGPVLPVLVAVFALIDVALLVTGRRQRSWKLWLSRSALVKAALFVLTGTVFVVLYHYFFRLDFVTPVSLANNDIAYFGMGAEHLRRFGFDEPGNMVGTNYGNTLISDTVGTFFIELLPAALLDTAAWKTTLSTLFVGFFLSAHQLSILLHRGFKTRRWLAAAVAGCAMFSPLVVYCLAQGFLSQMFATGCILAVVTIFVRVRTSFRSTSVAVIELGILSAILWHLYPFAVFAGIVLGPPLRLFTHRLRALPRVVVLMTAVSVAGLLLSALLAPSRIRLAINTAMNQSSAPVGWPLPGLRPQELVGFLSPRFVNAIPKVDPIDGQPIPLAMDNWTGTAILVAILVLVAFVLRRDIRGRLAVGGVAIGMAAYGAYFFLSGVSYQQWKWAALGSPLLVASTMLVLIRGLRAGCQFLTTKARRPASVGVGVLVLLATSALFVRNGDAALGLAWNTDKTRHIRPELVAASDRVKAESFPEMGLRADPWEEMWMTAMNPDLRTYQMGFNYTPLVRANNLWVFEPLPPRIPAEAVAEERPVNDAFHFVLTKPGGLAEIQVLSVSSARAGESSWRVRITNRGSQPLVSPQDDPQQGTLLQVTQVLDIPDAQLGNGFDNAVQVISPPRLVPLPMGARVLPGQSYDLSGADALKYPTGLSLQFDIANARDGAQLIWTPESTAAVPS